VAWREGGLFNVLEVVFMVSVQNESSHRDQRIIALRPNFGYIKDIPSFVFNYKVYLYLNPSDSGMT
jgi:hypothetical protein